MLQGLYAAASGMEAQQTQLDAVANDISNIDTPGYQAEDVGFRSLLFNSDYGGVDTVGTGTGAAANVVGFSEAAATIVPTGQPLDVAVEGEGYIEVRQADGNVGLTRNGTLQLNATGELTTDLGMRLEPPITVPKGTQPSDVTIGSDGRVSVAGRTYGTISLKTVQAPNQLLPSGNGVFSLTAASGPVIAAKGVTLQQGSLVQSNVDVNAAMTTMMTAQQGFDMASKAIQYESQMAQIAATLKQ